MFVEAGQAEIFRAAQRDDTFKKYLFESISEIIQPLFGIHFWIKNKELTERFSDVLYQSITTLSNLQTLGEEYTGIIQINDSVNSLPKKQDCLYLNFNKLVKFQPEDYQSLKVFSIISHQVLMILLNVFGEKIVIKALQKLEKNIQQLQQEHSLNHPERKNFMISLLIHLLKIHLPFYLKFHKALFYFDGHYYELSKRLCGIKFVLVRYWLKDRSSLYAFKLLGIITLIQSVFGLVSTIYKGGNADAEKLLPTECRANEMEKNSHEKCPLCLNMMQMSSVTPCGHLFCWPCIFDWLQEKPKCPLCRQVFHPSRVVYLQN